MAKFAVIQTGGKQYLVRPGDSIHVEKLDAKDGAKLSFEALLVSDEKGKDVKIGTPAIKGLKIEAKVEGTGRGKKIKVIKFKPKSRYKRKAGHRQPYTSLRIGDIK